jgi:phosphotriesterase-related protein
MTPGAFVRTVLGDVDGAWLGPTYAHEHLVIDGGRPVELSPDFLLADVDRLAGELARAHDAGLRAAVDMMPIDCGRNPDKLALLSQQTGVHVIAATGLHHEKFYRPGHWRFAAGEDVLRDRFVADVETGIVERDDGGRPVLESPVRAGIIKVAGSTDGPSARDLPAFRAAAAAQAATGAPIQTHCEGGTGALEQLRILTAAGVPASRISLSHVDKVVDRGYHESILASGAFVVYDQTFRWGDRPNGTLQLIEWAAEDGRLGQVLLGMDAARQGYYAAFGGTPGLAYLLREFSALMENRGIGEAMRRRLFVANPAAAFAFAFAVSPSESR